MDEVERGWLRLPSHPGTQPACGRNCREINPHGKHLRQATQQTNGNWPTSANPPLVDDGIVTSLMLSYDVILWDLSHNKSPLARNAATLNNTSTRIFDTPNLPPSQGSVVATSLWHVKGSFFAFAFSCSCISWMFAWGKCPCTPATVLLFVVPSKREPSSTTKHEQFQQICNECGWWWPVILVPFLAQTESVVANL